LIPKSEIVDDIYLMQESKTMNKITEKKEEKVYSPMFLLSIDLSFELIVQELMLEI